MTPTHYSEYNAVCTFPADIFDNDDNVACCSTSDTTNGPLVEVSALEKLNFEMNLFEADPFDGGSLEDIL